MLNNDILSTLKEYTQYMQHSVTLVLQTGEHEKRTELVLFLKQICTVSEKLHFVERDEQLRSPITFYIESEGKNKGIYFSGIPGGHEFNSLVLAILHASGRELKLDKTLQSLIQAINKPLHFEVFVSLSCHNCPDVVQSLNQFALLNDHISSEMIDGSLFQSLVEQRNIQGVPCVYLNGKLFANGKIDTAQLVDKLITQFPSSITSDRYKQLPLQDVVIIGGGPAGIASAIYSARKGLKVTPVADRIGGQVKDTLGIENMISVPETTGSSLSQNLLEHLNHYPVTVKEFLRVDHIEKGTMKKIVLSSGEVIETKSIIIATGAKWRELDVPGEKENVGRGVAYCPHCDGPFFKNKDVAVIGGGNSGIEAALDLASIVNHVTVFEYAPQLKADKILVEKAEQHEKITILRNVATQEILADKGKVIALVYQDKTTEEIKHHSVSGVFVQIGLVPNSNFLDGVVERTAYGEIIIDERCRTSEPGIFAAGDVSTVPYKQIVIAMGEGAKAALSTFNYLVREG